MEPSRAAIPRRRRRAEAPTGSGSADLETAIVGAARANSSSIVTRPQR
jgi:hypothetical protein